ncbi:MAG: putative lipid II flippase FtsW [Clostridia bacterium]|nr:putative lipid II flippase FtsW [Clostridia bacterium]
MRGRQPPVDFGILVPVLLLLAIGLVMVLSASAPEALVTYGDAYYFFKRQLVWALLGGAGMAVAARIDYPRWRRWAAPLMSATLLALVLVLVPGVGIESHGARRWLGFSSLSLQPSEMAKMTAVVFFAHLLARTPRGAKDVVRGLLPVVAGVAVLGALIMMEPDLGTAVTIAGTAFALLVVAGIYASHALAAGVAAVPLLAYLIFGEGYRRQRFLAFLDPQADPLGAGYHITQGLYALGEGSLFGSGLGNSLQKYFYVPERHTDFIFTILADELGFVGSLAVILLFAVLAWRGFRVALHAPDRFGALLAAGVTAAILVQAVVNIGVVGSVLPITGIPLPFVSFGGSSLVFSLSSVGILLNVSRYARL